MGIMMMLTKAWIMSFYRDSFFFFFFFLAPPLSFDLSHFVCVLFIIVIFLYSVLRFIVFARPTKQIINSTCDNKVIRRSWHTIEIAPPLCRCRHTSIRLLTNVKKANVSKQICKQNHKHHFISQWRDKKHDFFLSILWHNS